MCVCVSAWLLRSVRICSIFPKTRALKIGKIGMSIGSFTIHWRASVQQPNNTSDNVLINVPL